MTEQDWTPVYDEEAYAARFVAEHGGHKQHCCVGNVMRCSCGEAVGRLRGEGLFIVQSCRVCSADGGPGGNDTMTNLVWDEGTQMFIDAGTTEPVAMLYLGEPYETPDGRM